MRSPQLHQQIQYWLLLLTAFSLPLSMQLNGLCIILLCANALASGQYLQKWAQLRQRRGQLLLFFFFCLLLLSFFFSEDKHQALFIIEQNLSLFFLPLFFAGMPQDLPLRSLKHTLGAFVAACVLGMCFCLFKALQQYAYTHNSDELFYHNLSNHIEMHAAYFAAYFTLCVFVLIYFYLSRYRYLSLARKALLLATSGFCLISIILLASKTILFAFLLACNVLLLGYVFYFKYRKTLYLLLGINVLIILATAQVPFIRERFEDTFQSNYTLLRQESFNENTVYTGATIRLIKWRLVIEILRERQAWWWGLSIGDERAHLRNKSQTVNLHPGNAQGAHDLVSYNPHNQYMHYLLSMGIIGLGAFVVCLFLLGRSYWQAACYPALAFLLVFALFSFTESTMATQKGIVFFTFFSSFFLRFGSYFSIQPAKPLGAERV